MMHGYNIFRNDRNAYGGGVACYFQSHLPVKVRQDLMLPDIEVLWLQVCLNHHVFIDLPILKHFI